MDASLFIVRRQELRERMRQRREAIDAMPAGQWIEHSLPVAKWILGSGIGRFVVPWVLERTVGSLTHWVTRKFSGRR